MRRRRTGRGTRDAVAGARDTTARSPTRDTAARGSALGSAGVGDWLALPIAPDAVVPRVMSGTLGARGPSRLVQMISDLFLGRFGGLNFALAQWAGGQFLGGQFFDG